MTVTRETYINAVEGEAVTLSHEDSASPPRSGLSVPFTIMCIVDLFGVFPIIALPASVIACGMVLIYPLSPSEIQILTVSREF